VFNIDIIANEEARTPFEFLMGGKTWRVPHVADLTLGQQIALDTGQTYKVLLDVAEVQDGDEWKRDGETATGLVLKMKRGPLGAMLAAWLSHAGHNPGESAASPS